MTGGWGQLHNEELIIYILHEILLGIKNGDEMCGTCSTHRRDICDLTEKYEEKRHPSRPRRRMKGHVKTDSKKIWFDLKAYWIYVIQNRD